MIIRKLEDKDISACFDIYNYYIENTTFTFEEQKLDIETFKTRCLEISSKYPYIVCEKDNSVIGYAYLSAYNERSAYRYTADLSIYTSCNHLHEHIGTLLLNEIEKLAKIQNIKNIVSIVTDENINSSKFHLNNGFILEGYLHNVGFKFNKTLGVKLYRKSI